MAEAGSDLQQTAVTGKVRIHRIVDGLEQREAEWLLELLEEHIADPFLRARRNPPRRTDITPEEEAALEEARQEVLWGEYVTAEEVKRRLLG